MLCGMPENMSWNGNADSVKVDAVTCKPISTPVHQNKEESPEILEQIHGCPQTEAPNHVTIVLTCTKQSQLPCKRTSIKHMQKERPMEN